MCLLFCFLKQKTAYEMRISDWSSDVCSSDLIGGIAAAAIGERAFLGHLGQERHVFYVEGFVELEARVEPAETVVFGGIRNVMPRTHVFEQIGRASCRERVCQYV